MASKATQNMAEVNRALLYLSMIEDPLMLSLNASVEEDQRQALALLKRAGVQPRATQLLWRKVQVKWRRVLLLLDDNYVF